MKIGILTYHRANNVGALLQNFALLKIFERNGVVAETIEYKCNKIEQANRIISKRSVKDIVKILMHLYAFVSRELKFKRFRKKYINSSSNVYSRANINTCESCYDAICVGSDQVWNMNLNGNDTTYLLDFVEESKKRIAYAGSFGYTSIPNEYLQETIEELSKFNNISVREETAKRMLSDFDIASNTVLDPTLLLSGKEWVKAFNLNNRIGKKYVFVYMVAYTPHIIKKAEEIAQKNGYELWIMHYSYKPYPNCKNVRNATPDEFLNYIYNAQLVLCSSFHAVCFSILFHKNFYYSLDKNKNNNNSRLTSLCNHLNLDRDVDKFNETPIDYIDVEKRLMALRHESLDYITNTINSLQS